MTRTTSGLLRMIPLGALLGMLLRSMRPRNSHAPKPESEQPSNDVSQPIAFACPFSAPAVAHRVCILLKAISASFTGDTGRSVQVPEDSLFRTARDALPWYEDALRTVQSAHANEGDGTPLVTAEPGRYLACLPIIACKPSLMIPDCHCAGCHVISNIAPWTV